MLRRTPAVRVRHVRDATPFFVLLTTGGFILLSLKYIEISWRNPEGGGVVTITTKAFGPMWGCLGGMLIIVDYFLTTAISAVAVVVVIAVGFTAFTISFQRFVDRNGGTAGDYGVVYRDKASLARIVRARGLRVDDEPVIDFLVVGRGDVPLGDPPYVSVTDRLHNVPPPCAGVLRSLGVLSACLPPR